MSESSGETNKVNPIAEDDPLAELAKLVSAGSVFGGGPIDAAGGSLNNPHAPDPIVHGAGSEARLTAPATEALDVSGSAALDFDAELGAQLEAELVGELYESEAPAVAAPTVAAPTAAPTGTPVNVDDKISSALDEALNLDGFISDGPHVAPDAPHVAPDAPQIEPQINFDSFEAEISAAAASGFPSVDAPAPSADFTPSAPVAPSVEPMAATVSAPHVGSADIATGAPIGDVDPLDNIQFETAEDDFVDGYDNDNKSNGKGMLAIAAVLLVALIGGAGAFFVGAFGDGSDEPVVVAADNDPVRIKPDDPGGSEVPNQDLTVYNTLDGEEKDPKQESRLVVRSEEPKVEDSELSQGTAQNSSNDDVSATKPPKGPRTVRTVVVRPDGTLVQPEVEVANVQPSTPAETSIVDAPETTVNEAAQGVASAAEELTPRAVSTEVLAPTPEAENVPASETQPEQVQVAALPPAPRANSNRNQSAAAQAQPTQQATPAPAATSNAPAANTGEFMVQLSSQRSEEGARTNFSRQQQRYSVLAGYSLNIQRADLGDRGVYHRVRVGPFARSAANTLCARVKSQGGDCIVRRQ